MKAILAYNGNGQYSLHHRRYPPIIAEVAGANRPGVYVAPGDPVGFRYMCEMGTAILLGADHVPLAIVGETLNVEVFIIQSKDMTPELRRAILAAQKSTEHDYE